MKELRCKRCGATLAKEDEMYICPGCGAKYEAQHAQDIAGEIARQLNEQKQERVAALRQQLWQAVKKEFYDRAEISRLAKEIKGYLPDDFFANFCDLFANDVRELNAFLYTADASPQNIYLWDMLDLLLRPLREDTLLAVNDLLARAGAAGLDMEQFSRYNVRLAEEAKKLDAGVYDVMLPRDVFVAYSSADMAEVGSLVEALEEQKISCFVAARNLQHGAIQNYEKSLQQAMDHCKSVIFVSSVRSRSRTCDALSVELPYIREQDIAAAPRYRSNYEAMPSEYKKPRVEYLLDAHTHSAADRVVEEFFAGYEYCYADANEAAARIIKYLSSSPRTEQVAPPASKPAAEDAAQELRREMERMREEMRRLSHVQQSALSDFEIENGVLKKYKGKGGDVVIPEGVTSIGKSAFEYCRSLTSVVIPQGVASIGEYAFRGCTALTSITIPQGVTSIGGRAFIGCEKLTSVVIPQGVASIGEYAFRDCTALTSITFPQGVANIGEHAFGGCTALTGITIPNSVTSIGESAFSGCDRIEQFIVEAGNPNYHVSGNCLIETKEKKLIAGCAKSVIPADGSVTRIGENAFSCRIALTSVIIPEGVISIGEYAFATCTALTGITIPNSVTSIGDSAFYACTALKSITIPISVTRIGEGAFQNCTSLERVIYKGAPEVAENAFKGCTKVKIKGSDFEIENGVLKKYKGAGGDVVIPAVVTSIGEHAFKTCASLTSVVIPKGVTSIGNSAFNRCTALTSVVIPEGVTSIGGYAFIGCTALTGITIPNSVTSIGMYAFSDCKSLTGITIPKSVTSIGMYAFSGCGAIKQFIVEAGNPNYHVSGNCLIKTKEKKLIAGCATSVIPADGSVTSIGESAFRGCTALTSVVIPEGVTSIGQSAFEACTALKSITMPKSVTSIADSVYRRCTSLERVIYEERAASEKTALAASPLSDFKIENGVLKKYWGNGGDVVLPEDVRSIGDSAFENCTKLTSIIIPKNVTTIGKKAFSGCISLASVTISDSVSCIDDKAFMSCKSLASINMPSMLTSIGRGAFSGCKALISISIPNKVARIGVGAFSGCIGIQGFFVAAGNSTYHARGNCLIETKTKKLIAGCRASDIPADGSVTGIGEYAFLDITTLKNIAIPKDITCIERKAFKGCTSLTAVIIFRKKPLFWPKGWDRTIKGKIIWQG